MFSLIITIISIALVTALALATIYYGGSAFRQGGDAAAAAKLINEGQQLSGAAAIVEANAGTFTSQTTLKSAPNNALASVIPSYADIVDTTNRAFVSTVATAVPGAVCAKVNEKAGLAAPVVMGGVLTYGCIQATAAADGQMVFKY